MCLNFLGCVGAKALCYLRSGIQKGENCSSQEYKTLEGNAGSFLSIQAFQLLGFTLFTKAN